MSRTCAKEGKKENTLRINSKKRGGSLDFVSVSHPPRVPTAKNLESPTTLLEENDEEI